MILPSSFHIEKCTSEEPSRYATHAVLFTQKCPTLDNEPALVSTNGHIVACLPVNANKTDIDGLIDVNVFRFARACGTQPDDETGEDRPDEADELRLNEKTVDVLRRGVLLATFPRPVGEFPRYENVIPPKDTKRRTSDVAVEYLKMLCDANGAGQHICVELHAETAPMRISNDASGMVGAIMPINLEHKSK